jgi:hypothetical protein
VTVSAALPPFASVTVIVHVPGPTEVTVNAPAAPALTVATAGLSTITANAALVDDVAVKVLVCAAPLNESDEVLKATTEAGVGTGVGVGVGVGVGLGAGVGVEL